MCYIMISMDILNQLGQHLKNGQWDEFIELLNQNPHIDLNIKCCDGNTLLHGAVCCRNLECVKELIKHGADVNPRETCGLTPLMLVAVDFFGISLANQEIYHIVKFLLESGADCNSHFQDGRDLLHVFSWSAIRSGSIDGYIKGILGLLLDHGANRKYEYRGQTAESFLRAEFSENLADFVRDYQVESDMKGVYDG